MTFHSAGSQSSSVISQVKAKTRYGSSAVASLEQDLPDKSYRVKFKFNCESQNEIKSLDWHDSMTKIVRLIMIRGKKMPEVKVELIARSPVEVVALVIVALS